MSRSGIVAALSAFALMLGAGTAEAQIWSKPIEIGFDGRLVATTGDASSTSLTLPIGAVRVALQLSDKLQLEPALSLDYVTSGGDNSAAYGLGAGLIWNFQADRTKHQWYARPFVNFAGVSGSGGVSDYQFELGGGFGFRHPLTSNLAARVELNYGDWLAHGENGQQSEFGLSFGLSFWTK